MTYKTKLNEAAHAFNDGFAIEEINDKDLQEMLEARFCAGSEWTLKYLSEQGGEFKRFTALDCSETVETIDIRALLASEAKLELMNQNCISLGLHESRVRELENKLALSEARFKRVLSQRDTLLGLKHGFYLQSRCEEKEILDNEISAITLDSLEKDKK